VHSDRRQLLKMLDILAPGDVVTVIDRLARSTFDLFTIVKQIVDAKAQFRSLAEPWADTGTNAGRLMLAVLGGLADVERDLIGTRTAEGRSRAKTQGQQMGRHHHMGCTHIHRAILTEIGSLVPPPQSSTTSTPLVLAFIDIVAHACRATAHPAEHFAALARPGGHENVGCHQRAPGEVYGRARTAIGQVDPVGEDGFHRDRTRVVHEPLEFNVRAEALFEPAPPLGATGRVPRAPSYRRILVTA